MEEFQSLLPNPHLELAVKLWLWEKRFIEDLRLFEYLRDKTATRTTASRTTMATTIVTARIGTSLALLFSLSIIPATRVKRERERREGERERERVFYAYNHLDLTEEEQYNSENLHQLNRLTT